MGGMTKARNRVVSAKLVRASARGAALRFEIPGHGRDGKGAGGKAARRPTRSPSAQPRPRAKASPAALPDRKWADYPESRRQRAQWRKEMLKVHAEELARGESAETATRAARAKWT